jgi:hypothetical protein
VRFRGGLLLTSCVLALAACQPRARRLLILDLNLTEPAALLGIADPWIRAGYQTDYRRFYPHLTRVDPTEYRALILLGGFAPEGASDALRPGDLAVMADWVRSGGIVVFGYAAGNQGSLDRWIMTRWLQAIGAGIAIGDLALTDTASRDRISPDPQPWIVARETAPVRGTPQATFPAGRNHALTVSDDDAVLAMAEGRPVIAAARLGDGLIMIMSRHALAALGPDVVPSTAPLLAPADEQRTRSYFRALARWTLRPAEWARIPPVRRARAVDLTGPPRALSSVPAPRASPAGVEAQLLTTADTSIDAPPLPAWTRRLGVRVLHDDSLLQRIFLSGLRPRMLDSVIEFLDGANLTAVSARARVGVVAESAHWQNWEREGLRNAWKQLGERLETTSIRWVPVIDLADAHLPRDTVELDALGDTVAPWSALDPRLWDDLLRLSIRAVARLASDQPEVIPAVMFDLGRYGMAAGFSDPTFRAGIAAVPGDSAWKAMLLALPAAARYDSLLESGRLGAFFEALENATATRAAALRTEARRFSRQLGFVVRDPNPPLGWFTLGLLRGFSDSAAVPLLFTRDPQTGRLLARLRALRARSISAIPVLRLDPEVMTPQGWTRLGGVVFDDAAGFWLDAPHTRLPTRPDSLARLVRQLTREARLPAGTGRR